MLLKPPASNRPFSNPHAVGRVLTWLGVGLLLVGCQTSPREPVAVADVPVAEVAEPLGPRVGRESLSVLGIGNSFTRNAVRYLKQIAESDGRELLVGKAALNGSPLDRHVRLAAMYDADPTNPKGRPYETKALPGYPDAGGKQVSLQEALTYRSWDIVTIQQVSRQSFKSHSYEPYASQLIALIRRTNPDAEIWIHQTWAYRSDALFFESSGMDQQQMHQGLVDAYDVLSLQHLLPQLPVGDAFALARQTDMWQVHPDPDFDFDNHLPGTLPKDLGGLNHSYRWVRRGVEKKRVLLPDRHHANSAGSYLAGCVWFESLFKTDSRRITFLPDDLSPEQASSLREIAHRAVQEEQHWSENLSRLQARHTTR